jgi:hypothetical protein
MSHSNGKKSWCPRSFERRFKYNICPPAEADIYFPVWMDVEEQVSTSSSLLIFCLDKMIICQCSTAPNASAGGLQRIAVLALPFILSANFAPDPFLDM